MFHLHWVATDGAATDISMGDLEELVTEEVTPEAAAGPAAMDTTSNVTGAKRPAELTPVELGELNEDAP